MTLCPICGDKIRKYPENDVFKKLEDYYDNIKIFNKLNDNIRGTQNSV